ncbi:insertion element protein [Rossellomorea sp. FS2]|uniref:insertion element protein n=1 Tax=Rossellomorea sp. FS2 TaxID=3391447 RepID=UPI003A4DB3C6
MAKLKRLVDRNDNLIEIEVPVSDVELQERKELYEKLPPNRFATKFRSTLFRPVKTRLKGQEFVIQMNCCMSPYCSNFGLPQVKYDVKGKPQRYTLDSNSQKSRLYCNSALIELNTNNTLGCVNTTLSNWAIAEEIKRLEEINSVVPMETEYQFHRDDCEHQDKTPFNHRDSFRSRGKSTSNSPKYQCKFCSKITNVLPTNRQSTTYHQKRNDILPIFAELITNHVPVRRVVKILGIGSETYYHKLKWLYRRCLEFLERHEVKLKDTYLNELFINTDKMVYNLNNSKKKNAGSRYLENEDEKNFQTHVVVSSDILTRYVFRADVAYDWDITFTEINDQTQAFKDDHLHSFAQRFGHLKHSYSPQPPTQFDIQSEYEYKKEYAEFTKRADYVNGLHVNSTYTTIAHLWHIRQLLNVKEWRFVTDQDTSIISALMRVFSKEVRLSDLHHFIYKIVDKRKSLSENMKVYGEARFDLKEWALALGIEEKNTFQIARLKLEHELKSHHFFEETNKEGKTFRKWAQNPITHPLPFKDTGWATVDVTTDVSSLESRELARLIQKTNNKSTDTFINQI